MAKARALPHDYTGDEYNFFLLTTNYYRLSSHDDERTERDGLERKSEIEKYNQFEKKKRDIC